MSDYTNIPRVTVVVNDPHSVLSLSPRILATPETLTALLAETQNDTIYLQPGTYEADIVLPENINLVGLDRYGCRILGSITTSSNSRISRLNLSDTDYDGIILPAGAHDVIIEECTIFCNEWCVYGLYNAAGDEIALGNYNITVRNCDLAGANPLFFADGLLNSLIENNTGTYNSSASTACLAFLDSFGQRFYNNIVRGNSISITRNGSGGGQAAYIMNIAGYGNLIENNVLTVTRKGTRSTEKAARYITISPYLERDNPTEIPQNIIRNNVFTFDLNYADTVVYPIRLDTGYDYDLPGSPPQTPLYADVVLDNNQFNLTSTLTPSSTIGYVSYTGIEGSITDPVYIYVSATGITGGDPTKKTANTGVIFVNT